MCAAAVAAQKAQGREFIGACKAFSKGGWHEDLLATSTRWEQAKKKPALLRPMNAQCTLCKAMNEYS